MKQTSYMMDVLKPTGEDDILNAFAHDNALGYEWLSRKRIATLCERKVTPSLIVKIEALVDSGVLEKGTIALRNGVLGFVYKVIPQ